MNWRHYLMSSFTIFLLAMGFLTAPQLAEPVYAQAQDSVGSLRVGTWNVYLTSNAFRCLPNFPDVPGLIDCFTKSISLGGFVKPDQTIKRTNEIADQILSLGDQIDVIALNEVWDETAKDQMVKRLSGQFPNYISRVDMGRKAPLPLVSNNPTLAAVLAAAGFDNGEDSGLMFFARKGVAFLSMGDPVPEPLSGGTKGTTSSVRADTFSAASGVDGFASKGVAAVHIRYNFGKSSGRSYIVFTHMQADFDNEKTRNLQFRQIQVFIMNNVLAKGLPPEKELEKVFIVGDLNYQGERALLPTNGGANAPKEWKNRALSSSPSPIFFDSWASENAESYVGYTFPRGKTSDGERLDYLLRTPAKPIRSTCVQYSRVLLETAPSDHAALISDLNQAAPFCSPRVAAKVNLIDGAGALKAYPPGQFRIEFPGSMQWFHVRDTTASTVDFSYLSPDVSVALYQPDDLARSLVPVENVTGRRLTWSAPKEFYIRVYGKDRSVTGSYTPGINKRPCSSSSEPCYLRPTLSQSATFPSNKLLGLEDAAWFRTDVTEAADTGAAQTVTISVTAPQSYDVSLREPSASGTVISATKTFSNGVWKLSLPVKGTRNMLVRVARGGPKSLAKSITASWANNLQVTQIRSVICKDETNGFLGSEAGEDEISLRLQYDGLTKTTPTSTYISFDCNDTNDEKFQFEQMVRGFSGVSARLTEWDDGSPNNDTDVKSTPLLGVDELSRESNNLEFNFEGGKYQVVYYLRRGSSGLPSL